MFPQVELSYTLNSGDLWNKAHELSSHQNTPR